MNKWISRIVIVGAIGAILSSAIFAGCGKSSESSDATGNMADGGKPVHDMTSKP